MGYIVVDTCVFVRLMGDYKSTYNCFLNSNDVIASAKQARTEYMSKAIPSIKILQTFMRKLIMKNKMKNFSKSYIDAKVRRIENHRTINYPIHDKDKKWIRLAISVAAEYVISTDPHLLNVLPNACNNHNEENISPEEYISRRNPD